MLKLKNVIFATICIITSAPTLIHPMLNPSRKEAYAADFVYIAHAGYEHLVKHILETQKIPEKRIIDAIAAIYETEQITHKQIAVIKVLIAQLKNLYEEEDFSTEQGFNTFLQINNEELIEQARNGNNQKIKCLLAMGANIHHKTRDKKRTALHEAAAWGRTATVNFLVKSGARINEPDEYQQRPLHRAHQWQQHETIEKLIALGADQEIRDASGRRPHEVKVKSAEEGS